jgi:hypothetical protein
LVAVSFVSIFRRYCISSVDILAVGGWMTSRFVCGGLYSSVYVVAGCIGIYGIVCWCCLYCCTPCWGSVGPYGMYCVGCIYCP